jgi:hypothetical protein
MPTSTSHRQSQGSQQGGAQGGGGGSRGDEGGGGGGGGGDGPLIKVAFARNQPEAELIQGLLRESGIPSVLKRARGFDAPEFLAAGPHDIFVSSSLAEEAREVLAETLVGDERDEQAELEEQRRIARGETGVTSPGRLALWVGGASLAAVGLIWVLYELS